MMPDIIVMFFLLGVLAGLVRSDLTIPKEAYDILSLLLMLTIGLKGGIALHEGFSGRLLAQLAMVVSIGFLIPLILYPVLRRIVRLSIADSASFCAHYGSVSAGTFAVALSYAQTNGLLVRGEATLYLVMMELPAILVGIFLFRHFSGGVSKSGGLRPILHEALTNRSVILLVGGVVIGSLYGPMEGATVTDLLMTGFKAILALFLLEMGLTAADSLIKLKWEHIRLVLFALCAPLALAWFGIGASLLLDLPIGSALILTSLTASASYIAAPVAVRGAIPQADVGLAMLAALGLTFPLNVLIGIPVYANLLDTFGLT